MRVPAVLFLLLNIAWVGASAQPTLPEMIPNAQSPFKIVRSLPLSEPTYGARYGDLYIVAAERSLQVYRKTGLAPADYQQVNQIYTAPEMSISNFVISGNRLYVGAGPEGLLVYDARKLTKRGLKPMMVKKETWPAGWLAIDGSRLYVGSNGKGGLTIYDSTSLKMLGHGLMPLSFSQFTVAFDGVIYAPAAVKPSELTVVDATNPLEMRVTAAVTNRSYPVYFQSAPVVVGRSMYTAEYNGGVGLYDLSVPSVPVLIRRFNEAGPMDRQRGARTKEGKPITKYFATDGTAGYITRDMSVDIVAVKPERLEVVKTLFDAAPLGGGLNSPSALCLSEGILAVPTTVEGIRFYDAAQPGSPQLLANIDIPSRFEATAKLGRMVYSSNDVDGVWQTDWQAKGGPKLTRRIPLKGLSEDLVLYRKHLYVANGLGLATIDVSDEKNPHLVDYWDAPFKLDAGLANGWFEGVQVYGDILYVAMGRAGIACFSLQNPAKPQHLNTINLDGAFCRDISIAKKGTLMGCAANEAFFLLDISSPTSPRLLSRTTPPDGIGTGGGVTFSPDGDYLVLCPRKELLVYRINDPLHPVLARRIPWQGGAEDALFYKGYLLASGYGSGTWVYRIGKSVEELTLVQRIPTYFYNSKYTVVGDSIFTDSVGLDELKLVR